MKFSCTKDNLLHALASVGNISGKQVNLPILQNVLISMNNASTKIISTNLEIAIKANVRAKVEKEGEYTVPARLFLEYISTLPGERVDVELKENGLDIQMGNAKTMLKGMESSEFPLIPEIEGTTTYECDAKVLLKALIETQFAASKSDVRPELSGVLFNFNPERLPGKLVLAATDSFRLAEKIVPLVGTPTTTHRVIVPGRTVSELTRIIATSDQTTPVIIKVAETQITFNVSGTEITSRLIDGQYPHYEHIIPTTVATQLSFLKDELSRQVKAASLFTAKGIGAVQITCNPETKQLAVNSTSAQTGEHFGTIDAEGEGQALAVFLNHRYLLDGLAAIENERVIIKMAGPDAPVLLIPQMDTDYLYMIMPIKQ